MDAQQQIGITKPPAAFHTIFMHIIHIQESQRKGLTRDYTYPYLILITCAYSKYTELLGLPKDYATSVSNTLELFIISTAHFGKTIESPTKITIRHIHEDADSAFKSKELK